MATRTALRINRRFYTWFAVCSFLIIFAGFAHTYYLRLVFETKRLPPLLHLRVPVFYLVRLVFYSGAARGPSCRCTANLVWRVRFGAVVRLCGHAGLVQCG